MAAGRAEGAGECGGEAWTDSSFALWEGDEIVVGGVAGALTSSEGRGTLAEVRRSAVESAATVGDEEALGESVYILKDKVREVLHSYRGFLRCTALK